MKVVIIGGSGFIGSKLSSELLRRGHSIVSVDRNNPSVSGVAFFPCSCEEKIPKTTMIRNPDCVINLAGRSIQGPWNQEHKDSIYASRITTTRNLVDLFKDKDFCPKVLIQASATGIYGNRGEEALSEGSSPGTDTFLSRVAHDWEREGSRASKYGIRTVILRQGNVLGISGFLSGIRSLYLKNLGGPIGSGINWFPWIHIDDLVRIYIQVIEIDSIQGVINAVAPESVRYKEFSKQYAISLKKKHFLRIPKIFFRFKYRGLTDEITASQKVISLRLWEIGSIIQFKTLQEALCAIEKKHDITSKKN